MKTLKTTLLLTIIYQLSVINCFAQIAKIDSLENLLQQHPQTDTMRVNILNEIAHAVYRSDIDKTLRYATIADSLSTILDYKKGKAESLRLIGIYYKEKSDYNKALAYYQKTFEIYEELGDQYGTANYYTNIGNIYMHLGNYPKALEQQKKALKIAEEFGYKTLMFWCNNNIGVINRKRGNNAKALEQYQKALKIAEELDHKSLMSISYNNIGVVYMYLGNYPKALEQHQKSLGIKEELGDKSGMSASYNNIGEFYMYQGEYSNALDQYQQSLKIKEELGDKLGMSECYNNIGNIYMYQDNYSTALEYCQKSLKISEELDDKPGMSSSYYSVGKIYYEQNNYPKALECYKKGLELAEEIGSQREIISNNIGFCTVYYKSGKYSLAIEYGEKGYKQAVEIGEKEKIKIASEILALCYAANSNFQKAYTYDREFKAQSDSLQNEEYTKKITGLEYEYKYEKEKELAAVEQQKKDALQAEELKRQKLIRNSFIFGFLLVFSLLGFVFYSFIQKRKSNRLLATQKHEIENKNEELTQQKVEIEEQSDELKSVNEKLLKLNQTKDKFFSIIGHDLRGPMSTLSSFTFFLKEHIESMSKKEISNLAVNLNESLKGVNHLLENLLNWSRSQSEQIDFKTEIFNLSELLEENKNLLNESAKLKGLIIDNQSDTPLQVEAHKHSINMVIRNLLSNAIKFTTESGKITLSLTVIDDEVWVSVLDTGVGMNQETIDNMLYTENITSSRGTANETGTGLGISLCKEFVERNGGTLRIRSEEGEGSEFSFSLPLYSTERIAS